MTVKNDYDRGQEIYNQLLTEGVDPNLIIAGSSAYARQVKRTGERPIPLPEWLLQRGWEKHLQ
ncbi:hypothetical protein [Bradyrhizobium sp. AUGA SZCCT0042]|uniref:hypothetical protein n=1 Tax=Bradyrhizobium sp. AUGA SZCCT0042 TaxID=2807651 RepID=UPI001BA819E9|nr:hypothetical protein [Bradyrhizobium sp. AUGA SZCCT0042]MBR1298557.1 hypothetical protein [Bradyrhizobium sp. AUGA SZCCT0042]